MESVNYVQYALLCIMKVSLKNNTGFPRASAETVVAQNKTVPNLHFQILVVRPVFRPLASLMLNMEHSADQPPN